MVGKWRRLLTGLDVRLRTRLSALATERGASAVEYALLAAFIAAVIVALLVTLGTQVRALFCTAVDAIVGSSC